MKTNLSNNNLLMKPNHLLLPPVLVTVFASTASPVLSSLRYAIILLAIMLQTQLQAETTVFTTSSGSAGADTWVANGFKVAPETEKLDRAGEPLTQYGSATENNGNKDRVIVGKMTYGNREAQALYRFDVSAMPKGAVKSATLMFPLSNSHLPGYHFAGGVSGIENEVSISVFGVNEEEENWDEKTVTWESGRPKHLVPVGSFTVHVDEAEGNSFSVSGDELVSFLKNNTNGVVSFLLSQKDAKGDDNHLAFDSKEISPNGATLAVVTVNTSKP